MPPAGNAETTDSRAGASSTTSGAPRSRKFLAGVLSSKAIVEQVVSWPILALIAAVVTPLLTFLSLWLIALFPNLRPWTPPEARTVSISDAVVAERRLIPSEERGEVTVVTFKADVTGYAASPIAVATLWLDPVTQRRVEPELRVHGLLVSSAKSNQSVGWLDVPYPLLPNGVQGCLILRVLLLLVPGEGLDPAHPPRMVEPTGDMPLLAYTDTPPFEPYEDGSCSALEHLATPETG